MNLKLGDFVRFVDENLEGYITRIIDKDTIGVTDSNDFEIPVLMSKVTLVHGDATDNQAITPTAAPLQTEFIKDGVFLGIVTDKNSDSVAHFHIVNQTSFQLLISLTSEKNGDFRGEFANFVNPHSAKKIYSDRLGDIQIWPKFRFEILFHTQTNVEPKPAILLNKNLKGKDLSIAKENIDLLNQKGWLIRLDEPQALIDPQKLKESFFKIR